MRLRPERLLLESARCVDGVWNEAQLHAWVESRRSAHKYSVERIAIEDLSGWRVDSESGDIRHASGRFFSVTGLDVRVTTPTGERRWSQPIIDQPEVGILGFLARRINGVVHLLVQAKMEPGNVNLVQLSPTVQATRSNYTRAHGGRETLFLEYFTERSRGTVLVDQLQSEQGTRYYCKRNRNVIVLVADDEPLPTTEDFAWATIGQLARLTAYPNLVHVDCRTILGSVYLQPTRGDDTDMHARTQSGLGASALGSLLCEDHRADLSMPQLLGWLAEMKIRHELQRQLTPLNAVTGWRLLDGELRHESGRFFSVIGVRVRASSREVVEWSQPLIAPVPGALLGLVCQQRGGALHFLIQARLEPGLLDAVELAPTVQYTPANYGEAFGLERPPFADLIEGAPEELRRVDTVLSEEGGRFYHSEQRHLIVELPPDTAVELPIQFAWATLAQLQACARFTGVLNIELRSLLACVPLD